MAKKSRRVAEPEVSVLSVWGRAGGFTLFGTSRPAWQIQAKPFRKMECRGGFSFLPHLSWLLLRFKDSIQTGRAILFVLRIRHKVEDSWRSSSTACELKILTDWRFMLRISSPTQIPFRLATPPSSTPVMKALSLSWVLWARTVKPRVESSPFLLKWTW